MNYPEGVEHMKGLVSKLKPGKVASFSVGVLKINYPGKKKNGDYQVSIDGVAPTHTDIVNEVYTATSKENIHDIIELLDDVYQNGLNATSNILPRAFIEKLYWITMQEEINYPQPKFKGRKLPFQRFYEAALAKVSHDLDLKRVHIRTNNHGVGTPRLLKVKGYPIPSFYC